MRTCDSFGGWERDIRDRGRTMDSVVKQYLATVRPMHLEFVEPSKRNADIILPEGGYNQVGTDLVIQKIRSLIPQERAQPDWRQSQRVWRRREVKPEAKVEAEISFRLKCYLCFHFEVKVANKGTPSEYRPDLVVVHASRPPIQRPVEVADVHRRNGPFRRFPHRAIRAWKERSSE